MGFSSYFLIVWDLIAHARGNGIRVGPGRGSAAGCAVAYCLRITDLDPIRYDLLFERFLNPSRISMPDIDMDFDSRYRDEMIRYAAERYGRDHVAQIVTFGTIKARAAVRDGARVLGYPYAVGDKVAKAMPPLVMGRDTPLRACLEPDPAYQGGYAAAAELRGMYDTDPDARRVIDVAKGLEGLRRQDGIHAAAVVITDQPLTDYLPVQRKPEAGKDPEDAPVVTQYEMHGVEDLGLLKMDFLGLRNLDVITDTVALIEAVHGTTLDIDAIPLDDPATLALLRRGDSMGVFQLEGGAMRALMRSLAPTSFDDVAALVALYRPGPMAANMHNDYADRKNGRQPISYLHPDAEEILADTQGLMIFQESVMRVAQRFAGYSLAEADNLRKACAKKIKALIVKERETFVAGCEANGYGAAMGEAWFDIIEPFADYAFPKSHSYGYGLISFQTAYLKANHPVEYLACLLGSVKDDQDRSAVYLAECRQMGIPVLVPDVNRSELNFTARYDVQPDGTTTGDHPLRPGRRPQRGRGLGAPHPGGQGGRPVPRLLRLLRSGRHPGPEQAGGRVAHQGRCLRQPRPRAQGPPQRVRPDRRPGRHPPPGARCRGHEPVRGGERRHPVRVRRAGGHPRAPLRQDGAPGLREGDARPVRERPPPDGCRARPRPPRRLHHRRAARRRTSLPPAWPGRGPGRGPRGAGAAPPCGSSAGWSRTSSASTRRRAT